MNFAVGRAGTSASTALPTVTSPAALRDVRHHPDLGQIGDDEDDFWSWTIWPIVTLRSKTVPSMLATTLAAESILPVAAVR